jgi:hypothetical protein
MVGRPKGIPKTGGRQKGTPNKGTAEIKALARQYGEAAVRKLAEKAGLVPNKVPADTDAAQIAAIKELLDRGYGKATQPISGDDDAAPLGFLIATGVPRATDDRST